MNSVDAYLKFVDTLAEYNAVTDKRHYDLGSMLSDIDAWGRKSGDGQTIRSADPAAFANWQKAWDRIVGEGKEGTSEQVFQVAKAIIDYYVNVVKYKIGDAENYLREKLGA